MLKRLIALVVYCSIALGVSAAQESPAPTITSFTSTLTRVDRQALEGRTARVPVIWTTADRPLIATLIFEQVFSDGSVINVELPRLFPWVNSSGTGFAAPIAPEASATEIKLRVRLAHIISGVNYDEQTITLPISTDGSGSVGTGNRATITSFTTTASGVKLSQLNAKTARLPVAWTAINRPFASTLVFEQMLPNDTYINIELPRDNAWVNSSDKGVVAPVLPEGGAANIKLRVRLTDPFYGRTYDQRVIYLPVEDTPPPGILRYESTQATVQVAELISKTARVPVAWEVINRPPNSNLIFEQIVGDGTYVNVELPRSEPIVPSTGSGVVAPIMPLNFAATSIELRLRLVDLETGAALATSDFMIPIIGELQDVTVYPSEQCYLTPFPDIAPVSMNEAATVTAGVGLTVYSDSTGRAAVGTLANNEAISIDEGPVCFVSGEAARRRWKVTGSKLNITGWVDEYEPGTQIRVNIARNLSDVQVKKFTVTPTTVQEGAPITISWEVTGTDEVIITASNGNMRFGSMHVTDEPLPPSGTTTFTAPKDYRYLGFSIAPGGLNLTQVDVTCKSNWFATGTESYGCPQAAVTSVQAAYQPFENGMMIWRDGQIWVLYPATGRGFNDTWAGEDITYPEQPPAGLYQPTRGFGKVWVDEALYQSLGWATTPEQGYTAQFQVESSPGPWMGQGYAISLPNGGALLVKSYGTHLSWQRVSSQ